MDAAAAAALHCGSRCVIFKTKYYFIVNLKSGATLRVAELSLGKSKTLKLPYKFCLKKNRF